ncbi:hypothetical protein F4782DRAFT_251181 [Xylaria castorea]|nr:hypothetical protein F4782DRAFT_251181 [Xylaria castorea]
MSTHISHSNTQGTDREALTQHGTVFIVQDIPLTPEILDHGYYSSRLQIAAPVTGWGRLAYLPNELIYMVLEQCSMETLLNVMLVNRGALEFVLNIPGFDRILSSILVHIDALENSSPALDYFLATLKNRTYTFLRVITRARECYICGCALVGIPLCPSPRCATICLECGDELGNSPILDLHDYRRLMAKRDARRTQGCLTARAHL